jgi:hypothetical protein
MVLFLRWETVAIALFDGHSDGFGGSVLQYSTNSVQFPASAVSLDVWFEVGVPESHRGSYAGVLELDDPVLERNNSSELPLSIAAAPVDDR